MAPPGLGISADWPSARTSGSANAGVAVRIPAVAMPAAAAIVFMAIFENITSNSFRYVPVI
jgi:hypothetical protein